MLKDELTLLINTCDKFSDLWETHIKLLNTNWSNRNIDTLLVTDKETLKVFNNVNVLSAGDNKELSDRIKYSIPYINTKYVLITLDDYFPIYEIDSQKIKRLIDIMEKEDYDYVRLFNDPNSRIKTKYSNIYSINLEKNYDVNLYQGIWKKDFLSSSVRDTLNAWDFEVSLTKVARDYGARCALSTGKEFELLDVVRKGKLLHKANRYLKKNKLYDGNREVIQYREEIRIYIFAAGKKILPKKIALFVKLILTKSGVKFHSESL